METLHNPLFSRFVFQANNKLPFTHLRRMARITEIIAFFLGVLVSLIDGRVMLLGFGLGLFKRRGKTLGMNMVTILGEDLPAKPSNVLHHHEILAIPRTWAIGIFFPSRRLGELSA